MREYTELELRALLEDDPGFEFEDFDDDEAVINYLMSQRVIPPEPTQERDPIVDPPIPPAEEEGKPPTMARAQFDPLTPDRVPARKLRRVVIDDDSAIQRTFGEVHDDRRGGSRANPGVIAFDAGVTGAPAGRPRRGTKDPVRAAELLLERCPDRSIEQLRAAATTRGRPAPYLVSIRAELDRAIATILDEHRATSIAIAGALGCTTQAVDKMRARGLDPKVRTRARS